MDSSLVDASCGSNKFLEACTAELARLVPHASLEWPEETRATGITCADSLATPPPRNEVLFDLAATNPPFSATVDSDSPRDVAKLKTGKTELLFIHHIADRLQQGGRAAILLPSGFTFGSSQQHIKAKKRLVDIHRLEAVFTLPSGVFSPYAGIQSVILVFGKGRGRTDHVWMHSLEQVGFTLNKRRRPIKENDLPEAARRFKRRLQDAPPEDRKGRCFFVDVDDIHAQDYDLTFSRYQEFDSKPEEYESPEAILRKMMIDQVKINECLDSLAEMTGCSFRTKDFMQSDGGLDALAESLNIEMRVSDFKQQEGTS